MNFTKDNLITIDKNKVPEDTLVIKINDMYFPLMNFNTPAPTPETTGAEYFKCAGVGTAENGGSADSGTTSASTDIIVAGAETAYVNGTYKLVDESATGYDRVWTRTDETYGVLTIRWMEDDSWYILTEDESWMYCDTYASENPYDTEWVAVAGAEPPPTVTQASSSGSAGTLNSNVIVSGAGSGHINGTYTLTDIVIDKDYLSEGQKKVYSYYWADLDQTLYIYYDWNTETWWISDDYNNHDIPFYGSSNAGSENPWEGGTWETGDASDPAPTVTQETTSGAGDAEPDIEPEKVWIGYKAILKEETEIIEIPGIASVVVSGCTYDTDFNGTYILVDESATGTNRVWKNEKNKYLAFNPGGENWCLYAELDGLFFYNNWYPDYPNYTIPENPWDAEHWENINGGSDVPVLTVNETPGTTETKTVKYYEFEETLTTDLTYGYGFTPVVGKVYDREAMVEATLFEKYVSPISSPENMTDFENDEWLVSSTAVYDTNYAWKVFDGNVDSSCWLATSSPKDITWKNKKGKVLVKQIQGYFHDNQVWRNGSFVQGSNDGETWTDLFRGDFWNYFTYEDDKYKLLLTFPDNATSYQYHRIGTEYGSGSYGIIYELSAKSIID